MVTLISYLVSIEILKKTDFQAKELFCVANQIVCLGEYNQENINLS